MMVDIANSAAKALNRNIQFNIKLVKEKDPFQKIGETSVTKTNMSVVVLNLENKTSYEWSIATFESRLFMIKQLVEDYHDSGILPVLSNEDDPFWDPEDLNLTKANKEKLEKDQDDSDSDDEMLIYGNNNMHKSAFQKSLDEEETGCCTSICICVSSVTVLLIIIIALTLGLGLGLGITLEAFGNLHESPIRNQTSLTPKVDDYTIDKHEILDKKLTICDSPYLNTTVCPIKEKPYNLADDIKENEIYRYNLIFNKTGIQ